MYISNVHGEIHMQYILEFMREGFKDFGGKIIGGVLLFLAVKYFPILKKLFRRKDDPDGGSQTLLEIQNSVATIHEKLETYHQEK